MHVGSILKSKGSAVVTIGPEISVKAAVAVLNERRIGAVVVVEKDGRIAGILSERDIVKAIAESGARALDVRVGDLMTHDVVTCAPEDTVDQIMAIMTQRRVRHVPVVENNRLAGIVSIGDVVKSRIEATELEAQSLREYVMTGH